MNLWVDVFKRCHNNEHTSDQPKPPQWKEIETLSASLDLISGPIKEKEELGEEANTEPKVDEKEYGKLHRQAAKDAIAQSGSEAIAFYAPIHHFGEQSWGIYIHERNFFGTCAEIASLIDENRWDDIIADLYKAVIRHEVFHSATELFCLILEDFAKVGRGQFLTKLVNNDPKFPPDFVFPELNCPFKLYSDNVFWPTDKCVEEGLATAFEMTSRFSTPGFRRALCQIIELSPSAYRRWTGYAQRKSLTAGVQDLARTIIKETDLGTATTRLLLGYCQDMWFPELDVESLDSKGPIPRRIYHQDTLHPSRFKGILGNIFLKDVLNRLKKYYGARVETGGKHRAIVFPNGKKIPFPVRRTLPPYLINQIAVALGVERKEILSRCLGP